MHNDNRCQQKTDNILDELIREAKVRLVDACNTADRMGWRRAIKSFQLLKRRNFRLAKRRN
jgi:hypothetical protein